MRDLEIPLFPLRTVLFPGGPLPLRIFEPRYLDMVGRCLKEDIAFGVLLLRDGSELGPARTYEVGVSARIVDWYQGSDGLLGITARGEGKFERLETWQQKDGLNIGRIRFLPAEPRVTLPKACVRLADLLEDVLDDLGAHYRDLPKDYTDASWVGHRLSEILPIPLEQKQHSLELSQPLQRLQLLLPLVEALGSRRAG
jgi:Lon protease-like protein